MTTAVDARAVANCLLDLSDELGIPLTNLQLQKIVFFAHGLYFEKMQRGLIANRFEAWDHGPVVPELYHALKQFGDAPVTGRAQHFDLVRNAFVVVPYALASDVVEHLREILQFYGRMTPWDLVRQAHDPEGPWRKTIDEAKTRANFGLVIESEDIEAFFCQPPTSRIHSN